MSSADEQITDRAITRASSPAAKSAAQTSKARRGRSRVRRNTHDIDSEKAQIHAPLGDDRTLESSQMQVTALFELVEAVHVTTANAVRYGQGVITRVARDAVRKLFDPKHGFDHWSGTNDLAGSQLAERAGFSKRQWLRVKPQLAALGIISFVHRSIKTGLSKLTGVDEDLQVSDLYWFSPSNLAPWLREIFDAIMARLEREAAAREKRSGAPQKRTPLVKRDRPHRRIPALLNPVGWARALAAEAKAAAHPAASYAADEARALAFATRLALDASSG